MPNQTGKHKAYMQRLRRQVGTPVRNEERRIRIRAAHAQNSESVNKRRRAARNDNRDDDNERQRAAYANHSDSTNKRRRAAHASNSDSVNARRRATHASGSDSINARRRAARASNSEQTNQINSRRRKTRAEKSAAREKDDEETFPVNSDDELRLSEDQLKAIMDRLMTGETMVERQNAHNSVFRGMDKDVNKALLLYYLNSGGFRFDLWKRHSKEHDGKEIDVDSLVEEILSEELSEVQLKDTVDRFCA